MHKRLLAAIAIGATIVIGFSAFAASSGSGHPASLRVTRTTPLTVSGAHFKSRERVRVTATVAGGAHTRTVRASRRGSLAASFPIGAARCSAVRVVAIGRAGSRAIIKQLPEPACILQ